MELSFRCIVDECKNEVEFICSCSIIQSYCKDHLPNELNHCSNVMITKSIFESIYRRKRQLAAEAKQILTGSGKYLFNQIIVLINFYTKQIDSNSLGILDIENLSNTQPSEELKKKFVKATKKYLKVYKNEKPKNKKPKSYLDGCCKKCILLKNEKSDLIASNNLNNTRLNNEILRLESNIDQIKKEIIIKDSIIEQNKCKSGEEIEILKNKIDLLSSNLNKYKADFNYSQKLINELNHQQSFINEKESKILKTHEELIQIHRNILKDKESNHIDDTKKIIHDYTIKFDQLSKSISEVQHEQKNIQKIKTLIEEIHENKLKKNHGISNQKVLNNIDASTLDTREQTPQYKEEENKIKKYPSNKFAKSQVLKRKNRSKSKEYNKIKNLIKTQQLDSDSIIESLEYTKNNVNDLNVDTSMSNIFEEGSSDADKPDLKEESKSDPNLKSLKGRHKQSLSQNDISEVFSVKNPQSFSKKKLAPLNKKLPKINEEHQISPISRISIHKKSKMSIYSNQNLVFTQSEDFKLFDQNNLEGKKKILKFYLKENFEIERISSKISDIRKSKNDKYFVICKKYLGKFYEDCIHN